MKVLVTGATGFVGKKISRELILRGHELVVITRDQQRTQRDFPYPAEIFEWDYRSQDFPVAALDGVSAVVHLMGESIAEGRWTEARKKSLYDSRVLATKKLVSALQRSSAVQTFVAASAIGFYPYSASQSFTETSEGGEGFLQGLCADWEDASDPLESLLRRVIVRVGLVLGYGGALTKLEPLFSYGITSPLATGEQWMSWIHVDDLTRMFCDAVEKDSWRGVYNGCSPAPVTNAQFHRAMAEVFSRPMLPSTPAFMMRLVLGEMAQVVLGSQKVLPERALKESFSFTYTDLDSCLQTLYPHGGFTKVIEDSQFLAGYDLSIFAFFQNEKNLEKLSPSFLKFQVLGKSTEELQKGTVIRYRLSLNGIPLRWSSQITHWDPPHQFSDIQLTGPYQTWDHTHSFVQTPKGVMVSDKVFYKLPLPFFSSWLAGWKVAADVAKIFAYRREQMESLFPAKDITPKT